MRIGGRIFLVGGIPIAIAAAIAIASVFLLNEAERARNGAILAGTIYRNVLVAMTARDDYVDAAAADRSRHAERFWDLATRVRFDLVTLTEIVSRPEHVVATTAAREALDRYVARMGDYEEVTLRNDRLAVDMAARAATVIALTDEARERQHASNADIVASLSEGDRKLRVAWDLVDRAQAVNAAIAEVEIRRLLFAGATGTVDRIAEAGQRLAFALARLHNTAADLATILSLQEREDLARELETLLAAYEATMRRSPTGPLTPAAGDEPGARLRDWADRLVKINSTEQRALHDELAELLTYSVQAHETEQATQNIAIAALKLSSRTTAALAERDPSATGEVIAAGRELGSTIEALPISPLIQSEMLDAIDQWREGLTTMKDGLERQNEMIEDMDASAATMIDGARSLNDLLATHADAIGTTIRTMLIVGAAIGLLVGGFTGLAVARSITRPLRRLQQGMTDLAADPRAGPITGADRRDELGDMARATDFFVTEITRREAALRRSKERADAALAELQRTQAELIQAEKLASLGELVAGVAHEINTPLGVALTTSTLLSDEVRRFNDAASSRQLARSVLDRFVQRMTEGAQLLFVNLTRAANLVHSFKQVAADQASGERRRFDMADWLRDLLISLGPVLRKSGHEVSVACRPGLMIDTYPGALAQVVTNLLMNALAHAFPGGRTGTIAIAVEEPDPETVRIVFGDDGAGIPPENLGRVFDPFFTTGRAAGSTGLGLHIVYNLVTNRLRGRIELASEPGRGTRFTIELPVRVEEATAAAPAIQLEGALS